MTLPIRIDKQSGIPIYIQLAEQIRLLVHQGALKAGDGMPTVRTLAVGLGINANTVSRVYRELQTQGVLRLERGIGTFVAKVKGEAGGTPDFKQIEKKVIELNRLAKSAGMSAAELSQFIETRWQEVDDVQG